MGQGRAAREESRTTKSAPSFSHPVPRALFLPSYRGFAEAECIFCFSPPAHLIVPLPARCPRLRALPSRHSEPPSAPVPHMGQGQTAREESRTTKSAPSFLTPPAPSSFPHTEFPPVRNCGRAASAPPHHFRPKAAHPAPCLRVILSRRPSLSHTWDRDGRRAKNPEQRSPPPHFLAPRALFFPHTEFPPPRSARRAASAPRALLPTKRGTRSVATK